MSIKKWCGLTLGPLILFFLLCIILIARIDPFQAYHLATQYLPPIDKTSQVYSNPGIARNYPYDSAIVGTSVTENRRLLADELAVGELPSVLYEFSSGRTVH